MIVIRDLICPIVSSTLDLEEEIEIDLIRHLAAV